MNEQRPPMAGQPGHPQQPHAPQNPQQRMTPHPPPMRPGVVPVPPVRPAVAAPSSHVPGEKDLEPISLVEEGPETGSTQQAAPAPKKIQAFGDGMSKARTDWKRAVLKTGTGAVRVKSFHGKYSEQGLEYLDNAINEWLDNHPDVEVKFVTPTVMTFEGKIREPALVLNLWY